MSIVDTRTTLYMKRPEGKNLKLHDVLKSTYNEMIANEHDCEINQKWIYLIKDGEDVKVYCEI